MAHNVRLRADSGWITGYVVSFVEWTQLDFFLTRAVNGDGGGTWTPAANVVIGGAGMWLAAASNTLGGTNSRILTSVAGSQFIVHNDDDHIRLGPAHLGLGRDITVAFDNAIFTTGWDDQLGPSSSPVSTVAGATIMLPLRVHNGAILSSVTFRFFVGTSHGPPATLPQFRVVAIADGVRTTLLTNGSDGYVPFTPTPASAALWFAGGAVQSLVYTLNAGVVIDTEKYTYWAEVIEEQGASALPGNVYLDATPSYTGIADLRPQ